MGGTVLPRGPHVACGPQVGKPWSGWKALIYTNEIVEPILLKYGLCLFLLNSISGFNISQTSPNRNTLHELEYKFFNIEWTAYILVRPFASRLVC